MNLLAVPIIVFFTALTVLAFAVGIRRLLGIRLSATRTIIAGVIAFLLAGQIITAFGRSAWIHRRFPRVRRRFDEEVPSGLG